MTVRAVSWRPAAERDAVRLSTCYAKAGGVALEVRFLDELEAVLEPIASHPDSGSTRHADLFPELPKPLRFHPLRRFERILVYYTAMPEGLEIIRIRDAARGLDALLEDGTVD